MSVSLTPSQRGNTSLALAPTATGRAAPQESLENKELCALLGPLVSPLLQNTEGGLDLSKLPVASFEDFRSFLITQVRVDGIAFNEVWLDSYHAVLADDRHEPLLRSLYEAALSASGSGLDSDGGGSVSGEATELESHGVGLASVDAFESSREDGTSVVSARGGRGRSPSPGEGAATPVLPRGQGAEPKDSITKDQLHAFTADLIKVSGERFAGNHLRTKEGRARLSNILLDSKNFSHDLRSDLVKGIALGGRNFGTSREAYRRLNQEISVWNYTNTSVTKDELSRATHITLDILQEVASQQEENQDLLLRYLKRPQDVTRFSGLEKELQRTITDEAIQAKAEYIDWNRDNYDPKIALGVKLDELWLTLIDDARWQQSGSLKTAKNAAFVIKEIESFREKLNEANSEAEFLAINEGIRTLLKGGIGVKGKGTLRSLKDFTASSTVPGMFKDLPEVHRQSYDNLLQYSEELHYAKEMGETISIGSSTEPSPPKGPERSTGKAGAVAGGEVREPTGGTSLAPGPQARGSLAPQVELAGSQKADLNPHKDLASLPKVDLTTPTELTLLPKVSLLPKADEARTPQADASSSVIPAQFHPGQAFPNQDPAKKPKADPKKLAAEEAKRFTEAKSQFIHGLKQAKRSLWYQYKQHKALSRGISQTAKLFNKGDIQEIEAGQAALDKIIQQVEAAQDVSEMKSQIQEIQNQLRKDGPVYLAMVAAEMDGKEQLIGLGQTILIILATRQLGRGMARLSTAIAETQTGQRLANLAQQLRQHQLGQSIHRGMQNNVFAWRATKGFAMGAWISTAENGIAAATDEVSPEGHHAKSWAFDALATGVAMGIFTTTASYMGNSIEKNLLKRMMGRYFGNTKAPLHIIGDVIAEMGEETIDATLRAKLEDGDKALGFDQFREIAMVSGLGGFTKTGMIAEMLRGNPQNKPNPNLSQETKLLPSQDLKTLLPWGAGLATLMMPKIASADVGGAITSQDFWPGLFSVLGVGTLGALGVAIKGNLKNSASGEVAKTKSGKEVPTYDYHQEKTAEKQELDQLHHEWLAGGGHLLISPEASLKEILPRLYRGDPLVVVGAKHLLASNPWGTVNLAQLNNFHEHYEGNLGQVELFRDLAVVLNRPRLGIPNTKKFWSNSPIVRSALFKDKDWKNVPIRWQESLWLKKNIVWEEYRGKSGYDRFALEHYQGDSLNAYKVASSLLNKDEFAALNWGKAKYTKVKAQGAIRQGLLSGNYADEAGYDRFALEHYQGASKKAYLVASSLLSKDEFAALNWNNAKHTNVKAQGAIRQGLLSGNYADEAGYDRFALEHYQGASLKAYLVASSLLSKDEFAALNWGKQKFTNVKAQSAIRQGLLSGDYTEEAGYDRFALEHYQGASLKAYQVASSLLSKDEFAALNWGKQKSTKLKLRHNTNDKNNDLDRIGKGPLLATLGAGLATLLTPATATATATADVGSTITSQSLGNGLHTVLGLTAGGVLAMALAKRGLLKNKLSIYRNNVDRFFDHLVATAQEKTEDSSKKLHGFPLPAFLTSNTLINKEALDSLSNYFAGVDVSLNSENILNMVFKAGFIAVLFSMAIKSDKPKAGDTSEQSTDGPSKEKSIPNLLDALFRPGKVKPGNEVHPPSKQSDLKEDESGVTYYDLYLESEPDPEQDKIHAKLAKTQVSKAGESMVRKERTSEVTLPNISEFDEEDANTTYYGAPSSLAKTNPVRLKTHLKINTRNLHAAHPDGSLKFGILAADQEIEGKFLPEGTQVEFDASGKLIRFILPRGKTGPISF